MKTKLFLTMLLAIASVGAKADEVQCILPWGADEPWQMKFVQQEPEADGNGTAWTQPGYDDSQWETLTGPISTPNYSEMSSKAQYLFREWTETSFYLRRTFTLDHVCAEGYTFATFYNDDIRVYINGRLAIDKPYPASNYPYILDSSFFQEGENQLTIYYHEGGNAGGLDYTLYSGIGFNPGFYQFFFGLGGIVVDGIQYKINDDGVTAQAEGIEDGVTQANIREQITFNGQDYPVISISEWFGNQTQLESVFIPKTIKLKDATNCVWFWGATNLNQIIVDADNPWFDSRDNCNGVILTADNTLIRAGNNFVCPSTVSNAYYTAFAFCPNVFIPKNITSIEGGGRYPSEMIGCATSLVVEEENPRYFSPENSLCLIEKGTNKLISASPYATAIPEEVMSFGRCSLGAFQGTINYTNEYPALMTEDEDPEGRNCTLKVPEGTIPRFLGQGWGNSFKQITDGTHTYYGSDCIQGDTWFAPHIEAVDFTAEQAGEEVTLSVVLSADQPVTAFQFDLYLPEGMEMTFDEDEYENILLSTARTTERKHSLECQPIAANAWRVICYSKNNSTFEGNEGEVCTITVKPSADMANGAYPVIFKNITTTYKVEGEELAQQERDQITSYVQFFTPEYPHLGDANGDGVVNVTDIATIVSYIMGNNPEKFVFAMADAYTDGIINVTDIVVIIDAIMGEADPQQTKHRTASQQTPKATTTGVYNTAGQRINKMQRGVNIADGKKVLF